MVDKDHEMTSGWTVDVPEPKLAKPYTRGNDATSEELHHLHNKLDTLASLANLAIGHTCRVKDYELQRRVREVARLADEVLAYLRKRQEGL